MHWKAQVWILKYLTACATCCRLLTAFEDLLEGWLPMLASPHTPIQLSMLTETSKSLNCTIWLLNFGNFLHQFEARMACKPAAARPCSQRIVSTLHVRVNACIWTAFTADSHWISCRSACSALAWGEFERRLVAIAVELERTETYILNKKPYSVRSIISPRASVALVRTFIVLTDASEWRALQRKWEK